MSLKKLLIGGLLVALALAGFVSYYASSHPDGLEKVAEDKGFIATATGHDLADSPVADYAVRGVGDGRLSGGLAGVIGVLATFAIGGVLFLAVRGRTGTDPSGPSGSPGTGPADGRGGAGPDGDDPGVGPAGGERASARP